jgi:hypothetical protein
LIDSFKGVVYHVQHDTQCDNGYQDHGLSLPDTITARHTDHAVLFLEAKNSILFIEAIGCHTVSPSGDMNIKFRHDDLLFG